MKLNLAACPEGYRSAPLLASLSVPIPPGVYVDLEGHELADAGELRAIAGAMIRPTSDIRVRVGPRVLHFRHGTVGVLYFTRSDPLRFESTRARLHSSIELWPFELDLQRQTAEAVA